MNNDATNCPSCGSNRNRFWTTASDVEYQTTVDTFDYLMCEDCGCLFIKNAPIDRLSTIYPKNYYTGGNEGKLFSVLIRLKFLLDKIFFRSILRDNKQNDIAVLDVGGGSGELLTSIRASDPRVKRTVVVDLGDNGKEAAIAAGHIFHHGTFEHFETDERFDVLFLMNLIEHVADPLAVLVKAKELLRPGGRVVIQTPNWLCLQERLFRRHSWTGYHCPRHWVLWHKPGFEAFARRAGFNVLQSHYVQGASFWATSTGAVLRKWGAFGKDDGRPLHRYPVVGILAALWAVIDIPLSKFVPTAQMLFVLETPPTKASEGEASE